MRFIQNIDMYFVIFQPLRLMNVDENVAREVDEVLLRESDKEEILRRVSILSSSRLWCNVVLVILKVRLIVQGNYFVKITFIYYIVEICRTPIWFYVCCIAVEQPDIAFNIIKPH